MKITKKYIVPSAIIIIFFLMLFGVAYKGLLGGFKFFKFYILAIQAMALIWSYRTRKKKEMRKENTRIMIIALTMVVVLGIWLAFNFSLGFRVSFFGGGFAVLFMAIILGLAQKPLFSMSEQLLFWSSILDVSVCLLQEFRLI